VRPWLAGQAFTNARLKGVQGRRLGTLRAVNILLAPMEGLLDCSLRDALTRVGGVTRCVSEFIRITDTLLPERAFKRIVPELNHGGRTWPAWPTTRPSWLAWARKAST
jgi:tRNA-dihydrouridine synthase